MLIWTEPRLAVSVTGSENNKPEIVYKIFIFPKMLTMRDVLASGPSDRRIYVYKKIDFWTYYISCMFYCDCLNILEVTEGARNPPPPPPPPRSEKIQKSPV